MLLQDFVNKILKKNVSEGILEKIDKNLLSNLADFGHLGGQGVWSWVNQLKKGDLRRKSFSDNVERSSKTL